MPQVTFKAKIQDVYNMDDTLAYRTIKVPAITRKHCDMSAFRSHRKYGSYANSDMFPSMLKRALQGLGVKEHLRLDQLPEGVTVDGSGFLASVTIELT